MEDLPRVKQSKVIGILATFFLLSSGVSNFLFEKINIIASPLICLKIFCFIYALGFYISFVPNVQAKVAFIFTSFLKWCIGILAFHCLAILFGASILRYIEETFVWSLMMSTLVILPSCVTELSEIFLVLHSSGDKKLDNLASFICCVMSFTLFGSWLGAFVIPLDWDRDWQIWPIPCAIGAMTGHFVSFVFWIVIFLRWKQKNKSKFI